MKWISLIALPLLLISCSQANFESQSGPASEKLVSDTPSDAPTVEDGIENPELLDQYPCKTACRDHSKKVQICHVPPGNPENRHTICIGKAAVQAHLARHQASTGESDYLGECKPDDDETVTDSPDDI